MLSYILVCSLSQIVIIIKIILNENVFLFSRYLSFQVLFIPLYDLNSICHHYSSDRRNLIFLQYRPACDKFSQHVFDSVFIFNFREYFYCTYNSRFMKFFSFNTLEMWPDCLLDYFFFDKKLVFNLPLIFGRLSLSICLFVFFPVCS